METNFACLHYQPHNSKRIHNKNHLARIGQLSGTGRATCTVVCNVWKVSMWKHALQGVLGAWAPEKFWNLGPPGFRPSKCSENNTHLQYSESALVAIQLSRKLLLVLNVSDPRLFRLRADSFVCGANLKLRQANARVQAKVAQARAWMCRGLATPLLQSCHLCCVTKTNIIRSCQLSRQISQHILSMYKRMCARAQVWNHQKY